MTPSKENLIDSIQTQLDALKSADTSEFDAEWLNELLADFDSSVCGYLEDLEEQ